MKLTAILAFVLCSALPSTLFAQWGLEWTSTSQTAATVSGWLSFQDLGGGEWQSRYYALDSTRFRVMTGPLSQTTQYTYTFTAAERLAGNYIYSLGADLTGDGIVEFYVLGAYGTASPYRQSVKIFDITTGNVVFERNTAGVSYNYPTLWDVDRDGLLEAVYSRYDYPSAANYVHEVYQTQTPAAVTGERVLPQRLGLGQNYPNPFNPATRIEYEIPRAGQVRVEVLNLLGQTVETLVDAAQPAGIHAVDWNGAAQASGPYFYRLMLDGQPVETRPMLLVR